MHINLIEKARANRLIALEVLKQRDSNIVVLGTARKRASHRQNTYVFKSRRVVNELMTMPKIAA